MPVCFRPARSLPAALLVGASLVVPSVRLDAQVRAVAVSSVSSAPLNVVFLDDHGRVLGRANVARDPGLLILAPRTTPIGAVQPAASFTQQRVQWAPAALAASSGVAITLLPSGSVAGVRVVVVSGSQSSTVVLTDPPAEQLSETRRIERVPTAPAQNATEGKPTIAAEQPIAVAREEDARKSAGQTDSATATEAVRAAEERKNAEKLAADRAATAARAAAERERAELLAAQKASEAAAASESRLAAERAAESKAAEAAKVATARLVAEEAAARAMSERLAAETQANQRAAAADSVAARRLAAEVELARVTAEKLAALRAAQLPTPTPVQQAGDHTARAATPTEPVRPAPTATPSNEGTTLADLWEGAAKNGEAARPSGSRPAMARPALPVAYVADSPRSADAPVRGTPAPASATRGGYSLSDLFQPVVPVEPRSVADDQRVSARPARSSAVELPEDREAADLRRAAIAADARLKEAKIRADSIRLERARLDARRTRAEADSAAARAWFGTEYLTPEERRYVPTIARTPRPFRLRVAGAVPGPVFTSGLEKGIAPRWVLLGDVAALVGKTTPTPKPTDATAFTTSVALGVRYELEPYFATPYLQVAGGPAFQSGGKVVPRGSIALGAILPIGLNTHLDGAVHGLSLLGSSLVTPGITLGFGIALGAAGDNRGQ